MSGSNFRSYMIMRYLCPHSGSTESDSSLFLTILVSVESLPHKAGQIDHSFCLFIRNERFLESRTFAFGTVQTFYSSYLSFPFSFALSLFSPGLSFSRYHRSVIRQKLLDWVLVYDLGLGGWFSFYSFPPPVGSSTCLMSRMFTAADLAFFYVAIASCLSLFRIFFLGSFSSFPPFSFWF